ncbi:uncharacterized protein DUF2723 [Chitinophaga skermanii]|uniref:Uncharacterized protein DUF2723 n=1 Tax=Chitinophaga skermanii TaxID=331697 RepID=A0A327QY67_9BACT|nr:DUF2723 domain-containing protein [Chitinophaga skermanii]RAJ08373.1 uncharacterized protein DUF2723 [Chitinophaga skermanii]
MNFNRINNIVGWIVGIFACTVYLMTMEATGSLWDCGEFISAAYKVQVPHPPGAPLFVLIGRMFTLPFKPSEASLGINIMSALASGFTILFLFWTITHFARRIFVKAGETLTGGQITAIMGAGIVGAVAYTFSDSFWFSAVEGEVYAMSSLFTAVVFWAMLKWEHEADEKYADRWLVLIFYLMGLSIGVHLLNLLTIPAMVMIYYFKRNKATPWGTFWAFLLGCLLTGLIQKFIIQDTIKVSGIMDVFFVNSLGLPFYTGFTIYFIAIFGVMIYGYFKPKFGLYAPLILVASVLAIPVLDGFSGAKFFKLIIGVGIVLLPNILKKYFNTDLSVARTKHFVQLTTASIVFLLLGYSTYVTTLIRSSADPSVDMYNVDNPVSLVGYLGREQYGDFPLIYGQVFTAQPESWKAEGNIYARGKNKEGKDAYVIAGEKMSPVYRGEDMMLFPRVWDGSNEQGHADYYRSFLGLGKDEKPNFIDNIKFFMGYQVNFMYIRYFFWNFVGKQNDTQWSGNVRDGNWISGIAPIDNVLYGDQSLMPDSLANNKAHNKFYFLPLILGIIGFFFHYNRNRKDTLVVSLLFFFTGLAIVLYLNQAGNQPRERDYAYVGSFYAFAIWIGLGVLAVNDFLLRKAKTAMSPVIATVLCFAAVPLLMGFQGWDDHDRSTKFLARDVAKDYLESCAPNAILFTVGDNDTYPLWYAQEVEGIRPDVRVINLSLLGVDWYIDQQRRMVNQSPAVQMTWAPEAYRGDKRNYIQYYDAGMFPQDRFYNLKEVMQFLGSDDERAQVRTNRGDNMNYLPTQKLFIPVDKETILKTGTVSAADSAQILTQLPFQISKSILFKNDLAVLDIIAANDWKRPIYFTGPTDLGFGDYLRVDGLTYRLVPIRKPQSDEVLPGLNDNLNVPVMEENLLKKFAFGGAETPGTYFDEPNRRMLQVIRNAYTKLGVSLAKDLEKERALRVLNRADSMILEENYPYAMTSPGNLHNLYSMEVVYAYYLAGDFKKANAISDKLIRDMQQQMQYYRDLPQNKMTSDLLDDNDRAERFVQMLQQMKEQFTKHANQAPAGGPEAPQKISTTDSVKK